MRQKRRVKLGQHKETRGGTNVALNPKEPCFSMDRNGDVQPWDPRFKVWNYPIEKNMLKWMFRGTRLGLD